MGNNMLLCNTHKKKIKKNRGPTSVEPKKKIETQLYSNFNSEPNLNASPVSYRYAMSRRHDMHVSFELTVVVIVIKVWI